MDGPTKATLIIAAVLGTLFVAAVIRSALGFGNALIAMPLLALLIGVKTASPLVALTAATMTLIVLAGTWRQTDFKVAWRLVVATLVGIPFGLFFLKQAPESAVKGILGVVIIVFGLYNLIGPKLPELAGEGLAGVVGCVAGTVSGAYNTGGPPVVLYGVLRRWPPDTFRATLNGYLLPTGAAVLIGHAATGLWTGEVWRWYLYSLPAVAAGVLLGGRVHRVVGRERFAQAVNLFLIIMGIVLLF